MAEKKDGKKPPSVHTGHRKRTREEFRRGDPETFADHRLLELLLFYAIPQGDVNPLAHRLIDEFGSLAGVFHATYDQLTSIPGVGHNTAILLRLIPAIGARYMRRTASFEGQVVSIWQLHELMEPYFFGRRDEIAYIVCMDGKSKVLALRMLSEGVVDSVQIITRKVLEAAMACNASQVVLAHNHVSGVATPSSADVATTLHLKGVLSAADVTLLDHLIFAGGDMVSMAQSGLLSGRG